MPGIYDDGATYGPDPEACVDAEGYEYPEHDHPAQGSECRRCGAEVEEN
jgi:hypothetical protein